MVQISKRLSVEGPDRDGDYEVTLDRDWREGGPDYHYITRAEADALIDALSVRDASGRIVAPPQTALPERPAGPWDNNTTGE